MKNTLKVGGISIEAVKIYSGEVRVEVSDKEGREIAVFLTIDERGFASKARVESLLTKTSLKILQ